MNAILCDYVGRGENGKPLLINVISGDLLVGMMPADLLMGLYLECIKEPDGIFILSVDILLDDRRIGGFDATLGAGPDPRATVIAIQTFPIHIEHNSTLKIVAHGPGFRRNVIISKKMTLDERLLTGPIVSPQPSAQSPTAAQEKAPEHAKRRLSSRRPGGGP